MGKEFFYTFFSFEIDFYLLGAPLIKPVTHAPIKKILLKINVLLCLHEVVFPSLWQIQMESVLEHQQAIDSLQEALQDKDITLDQMYVEVDGLHAEVANLTEHQVFQLRKLMHHSSVYFSSSSLSCLCCCCCQYLINIFFNIVTTFYSLLLIAL